MSNSQPNPQDIEEKFKIVFERARKGVLKHLDEQGGELPFNTLHDYSLNKFFIQHQKFSELMETLVKEKLVDFDWKEYKVKITEEGKKFVQ